ncbi:MAG: hypothetical protein HXY39_02365 [Chloroflexi bacterium]|nr:hypothetical protein [Chloroflexota bacterium]
MNLPSEHQRVLHALLERLSPAVIPWAITGSCGFALHGLPVTVHDIDIQTSDAGAYAIARLFAEYIIRPVAYRESPTIRSHLGALQIQGVEVEIMGHIQKRLPDGDWEAPVDVLRHRCWIPFGDWRAPVLSLAYEAQAYERLGRAERARMLREWMARQ